MQVRPQGRRAIQYRTGAGLRAVSDLDPRAIGNRTGGGLRARSISRPQWTAVRVKRSGPQ